MFQHDIFQDSKQVWNKTSGRYQSKNSTTPGAEQRRRRKPTLKNATAKGLSHKLDGAVSDLCHSNKLSEAGS
jgi:hypothetical protein